MSVPDFTARDRESDVAPARAPAPKILDQRPDGHGYVLVTYSLPVLRRWTVRVPMSSWLNGEHLHLGAHAHVPLDAMLPPTMPDDETVPDDMAEQHG